MSYPRALLPDPFSVGACAAMYQLTRCPITFGASHGSHLILHFDTRAVWVFLFNLTHTVAITFYSTHG